MKCSWGRHPSTPPSGVQTSLMLAAAAGLNPLAMGSAGARGRRGRRRGWGLAQRSTGAALQACRCVMQGLGKGSSGAAALASAPACPPLLVRPYSILGSCVPGSSAAPAAPCTEQSSCCSASVAAGMLGHFGMGGHGGMGGPMGMMGGGGMMGMQGMQGMPMSAAGAAGGRAGGRAGKRCLLGAWAVLCHMQDVRARLAGRVSDPDLPLHPTVATASPHPPPPPNRRPVSDPRRAGAAGRDGRRRRHGRHVPQQPPRHALRPGQRRRAAGTGGAPGVRAGYVRGVARGFLCRRERCGGSDGGVPLVEHQLGV